MATIYKAEITSHWRRYTKEEVQKMLEDAIKEKMRSEGNEITIKVIERS